MLKLHDMLRSGAVKRWHMVNTTRIQTLAEHQHNVTLLSLEIASRLGIVDSTNMLGVVFYALVHDSAETRLGDMPSPTKAKLKKRTGIDFNEVFADFEPVEMKPTPEIQLVVKCADHLEGVLFLSEHRVGRHSDIVHDSICTEAEAFFGGAGDTGRIARQILSEVQNAMYEI